MLALPLGSILFSSPASTVVVGSDKLGRCSEYRFEFVPGLELIFGGFGLVLRSGKVCGPCMGDVTDCLRVGLIFSRGRRKNGILNNEKFEKFA